MTREVEVTRVYDWLEDSKAEINVLRGGTGSSKSYSTSQFFILNKLLKQTGKIIVIARRTLPALKKTAYRETLQLIEDYGIPYKENKTDLEYKVNGNILYFLSLDDPEKIKSLNSDDVWLEEATEFSLEAFRQFYLRLQGQMYLTFNPADANHWIRKEVIESNTYDVAEDISTYKDNPFLPEKRVARIENLINQDQNYWNIYGLGLWGILKNLIYSFGTAQIPDNPDEISYGIDYGFNNPSTVMRVYWKDTRAVWQEVLYQSGLTNTDLIEEVKRAVPEDHLDYCWYADSSEPARIEEFYRAGFNIYPADKSVKDGIDYCKSVVDGITSDSVNAIKEKQGYKYIEDKDGNVKEEPLKFNDHCMDAARYGTYRDGHSAEPNIIILGE